MELKSDEGNEAPLPGNIPSLSPWTYTLLHL